MNNLKFLKLTTQLSVPQIVGKLQLEDKASDAYRFLNITLTRGG